jgi:hypothetical protein
MVNGSEPLVDLGSLLGVSTGEAASGQTWLGRGDITVGLASVQPAARVSARKLVVTSSSEMFEVITVEGVEGLLLRPHLLVAPPTRTSRNTRA